MPATACAERAAKAAPVRAGHRTVMWLGVDSRTSNTSAPSVRALHAPPRTLALRIPACPVAHPAACTARAAASTRSSAAAASAARAASRSELAFADAAAAAAAAASLRDAQAAASAAARNAVSAAAAASASAAFVAATAAAAWAAAAASRAAASSTASAAEALPAASALSAARAASASAASARARADAHWLCKSLICTQASLLIFGQSSTELYIMRAARSAPGCRGRPAAHACSAAVPRWHHRQS